MPREQNNDVSGLTNLARNIGGSTGTAFVATMLTRRQQAHEAMMVRNLTPGNEAFRNQVNQLKGFFSGGGNGAAGGFGGKASGQRPRSAGVSLQSVAPAVGDAGVHGHHCGVCGVLRVHDSAGAGHGPDQDRRAATRRRIEAWPASCRASPLWYAARYPLTVCASFI